MGPKRSIVTNWEPYFVVYFQITLVSQRHSSMLVNKNCAFYNNELSIGPCVCYIQEDASMLYTVTGLPFDQMEPSPSMQHSSELSFTRGFMNELMTDRWRIIINNILPLPECLLDYFFKLTLNHQGPYNSKMNRY